MSVVWVVWVVLAALADVTVLLPPAMVMARRNTRDPVAHLVVLVAREALEVLEVPEALEARVQAQAMAHLRHLPWGDQARCLPRLVDMADPRLQCRLLHSRRHRHHLRGSRARASSCCCAR